VLFALARSRLLSRLLPPLLPRHFTVCLLAATLAACGGGGGGGGGEGGGGGSTSRAGVTATGTASAALTTPPTTVGNVLPVVVDAGPGGTRFQVVNVPYVSVTVCTPGTGAAAACQTIDHVLVDTGSVGLRLLQSSLSSSLSLPQVTNASGQAIGECAQFADGFLWGSVRKADVYLAGELAASVSIQDVGDQPGGAVGVPSDCSSAGGLNLAASGQLGARGILGVGLFTNDCDVCLARAIGAVYYACTGTGCGNTAVTNAQVVKNPVALFALSGDSNGVVMELPAVAGSASSLSGTLTFGIGTQANNALGAAVVYPTDGSGDFTARYTPVGSGTVVTMSSFVDSGSNGLFFNDAGIPVCSLSTGFYCPPLPPPVSPLNSPLALSAQIVAAAPSAASATVNFTLLNTDALSGSTVAANIGGPMGFGLGNVFDWGLPFFYGRRVFTAISGAATPGGNGPFIAF